MTKKVKGSIRIFVLIGLTIATALGVTMLMSSATNNDQVHGDDMDGIDPEKLKMATFGNGCFWCTEALFAQLEGVHKVTSGYSGGHDTSPTYKEVCSGSTGHAEVVQILYDPEKIEFEELLKVFWSTHDPTTLNRQGADVGTQYRSAVFYHSDEQKELAEKYKKKLDKSGAFDKAIVTEITKFEKFYPAEDYHQDYYELNGHAPYCQAVIRPKMEKFKKAFKDKLKKSEKLEKIRKTDSQWKKELTDMQFHVTREAGTEQAFTGKYWDYKGDGTYNCVCCNLPLFDSKTKYKSGTGWPSYWAPIKEERIDRERDFKLLVERTEVKCARCDAHLGHVFTDGPEPTGLRYCLNSAALKFADRKKRDQSEKPKEKDRSKSEKQIGSGKKSN